MHKVNDYHEQIWSFEFPDQISSSSILSLKEMEDIHGPPQIGFVLDLDDLIEKMKTNLPNIGWFPEILELNEHFIKVQNDMAELQEFRKEVRRTMLDSLSHSKKEVPDEDVEVLKISDDDDDDDIFVVDKSLPASTTHKADPLKGNNPVDDNRLEVSDASKRSTPVDPHDSYMMINDSKIVRFKLTKKMRVLGKKISGMWHKGTVSGVIDRETSIDQWKFRVNFDTKGSKILSGKEVALFKPMPHMISVGSRVCAVYTGEVAGKSKTSYYGGIVVEPPTHRNHHRFLVFFEDGYAQYCVQNDVFKVIVQNSEVWKDINPDSQEFIKDYIEQYPERPMVRLAAGQLLKTEYDGKWWTTRVQQVDVSLVKMLFVDDRRIEWIYRGSTRLEPLYTERAKTEELRLKHTRHNTQSNQKRKLIVEYPRCSDSDLITMDPDTKKRAVARKSTTNMTSIDQHKTVNKFRYTSISASQSSAKPADNSSTTSAEFIPINSRVDGGTTGRESMGQLKVDNSQCASTSRTLYTPHVCSLVCVGNRDEKTAHNGDNPLIIPMKCGWERHISRVRSVTNASKRHVFYQTPCGRRLRNKYEIDNFLMLTDSSLTIDLFCYDPWLHTHTEFLPVKTFCDIKDLTYNEENVPLPCVNGVDVQMPDFIKYSTERKPTNGVPLNLDPDFLVCCDCTDNCRDSSKCACIQLTVEASAVANQSKRDNRVGYMHRTLKSRVVSGIYECNARCNCDKRCHNRVVQNGLERRLQVYRTEKRGWGLRCLNDIPVGGFVCYYAGEILTSTAANEDGTVFGDEYLAEMDYIEVVEEMKEGYESDVEDTQDESSDAEEDEDDEESCEGESDSTFSGEKYFRKKKSGIIEKRTLPNRNKSKSKKVVNNVADDGKSSEKSSKKSSKKSVIPEPSKPNCAKDSVLPNSTTNKLSSTTDWVNNINLDIIVIDSDDEVANSTKPPVPSKPSQQRSRKVAKKSQMKDKPSRFKNLPDPKQKTSPPAKMKDSFRSVRSYYKDGVDVYVIDAKAYGNLGRYLNHSCSPNTFVQNVFVDTQDPRFPWVAFFASKYIRAGSELTWDYSYCVDSVPGKVLYCYCGSSQCRGRLL